MSSVNDFIIEDGVLIKYVGQGGDVVIPDGITHIGKEAFSECATLLSVSMTDSVEIVGKAAFMNCINLKKVIISKKAVNLDMFVFANCSQLEYVLIPPSVQAIGGFAFLFCPNTAVIHGERGSYVEGYAKMYKITFKEI